MGVNHGGRVARLLRGLVFIGVQREVIGAKGVAQSVGFARYGNLFTFDLHDGILAQVNEMLLESDFVACPEFAGRQRAERFKPRGQRGTNSH